ncbi:glycosyltransferase family 4 protein [candidate division TA06 bacterium]|nr:glycosyltransferase family 4 protein [candidate division TA06 bacterium]
MKVLFVCPAFPPKVCGVGNYAALLIKALTGMGLEISLLTGDDPVDAKQYGLSRVHTVSNWKISQKTHIQAILKSENPDIVHIQYQQALFHPGWLGLSLPGQIKRWLPKALVVVTQHDLNYPYLFKGAGRLGFRKKAVLRKMWEYADAIIIGYPSGADEIAGIHPAVAKRIFNIPIGPGMEVDLPGKGHKEEVCRKYFLDSKAPLLVSFGFIYRDKDFPLILRSLKALKEKNLRTSYIHVGSEGDEKTYLTELMKMAKELGLDSDIVFTGELGVRETSFTLCAADIGLAIFTKSQDLGRHSTLPLMLQLGKPLVVTDEQNRPEGETPWVAVPAGDSESLVKAITGLHMDQSLKDRLGAGALETYKKHYSPQAIGEKTVAVYRILLAQ